MQLKYVQTHTARLSDLLKLWWEQSVPDSVVYEETKWKSGFNFLDSSQKQMQKGKMNFATLIPPV